MPKRSIKMQKVKHIQAEFMTTLEQNIREFIEVFEADIKTMSITIDPLMNTCHAMIIYEEK